MDQIKAVVSEDHTEHKEQTYDIYLLPPGEDPESCQSYLRMRNKEGKYSLMFEVVHLVLSCVLGFILAFATCCDQDVGEFMDHKNCMCMIWNAC